MAFLWMRNFQGLGSGGGRENRSILLPTERSRLAGGCYRAPGLPPTGWGDLLSKGLWAGWREAHWKVLPLPKCSRAQRTICPLCKLLPNPHHSPCPLFPGDNSPVARLKHCPLFLLCFPMACPITGAPPVEALGLACPPFFSHTQASSGASPCTRPATETPRPLRGGNSCPAAWWAMAGWQPEQERLQSQCPWRSALSHLQQRGRSTATQ